jgi:hypothetical protein
MSDPDPRDTLMDGMLRRSMAAPVPRPSPDLERRVSRALRRRARPSPTLTRNLLVGYVVVSALTSVIVMRGQGLGWGLIAVMTLSPLLVFGLPGRLRGVRP